MVCTYKAEALTFLLCALYVDANYFNFYVSKYKKMFPPPMCSKHHRGGGCSKQKHELKLEGPH